MNIKKLIAYFITLNSCFCFSQVNKYGIPFIQNYSNEDYKGTEQNWTSVQDFRGMLYFGNNDAGLIEYDGKSWNSIQVPNKSIIRSLAIDDKGKVYVGAVSEFGYILPDNRGKINYHSLSSDLDSLSKPYYDIYTTVYYDSCIYFNSIKKLYKYKDDSLVWVKNMEQGFFFNFVTNDRFFIGHYFKGLHELIEDSIVLANGGDFYINKTIFSILPYKDTKLIVATHLQGIYIYDYKTGASTSMNVPENTQKELLKSQIYSGSVLEDNTFALGTLQKGCIIMDDSLEIIYIINEQSGLQNQVVTSLYANTGWKAPLFLTLTNGLSSLEYNNPIKRFGNESGIGAVINDIIEYNGTIYLATDVGVYYYDDSGLLPYFRLIEGITYQAWRFLHFKPSLNKDILLVGTQGGVYEIANNKRTLLIENQLVNRKDNVIYATVRLVQSTVDKTKVYVCYGHGIGQINNKNGKWFEGERIILNQFIKNVVETKDGTIWAVTSLQGLIKLNRENEQINKQTYTKENGLPDHKNLIVDNINDEIVIGTPKGFYYYDSKLDSIMPYDNFGSEYNNTSKSIYNFKTDNYSDTWLSVNENEKKYIEILIKTDTGYTSYKLPFKRLSNNFVESFYFDEDNTAWMAISDALYSFKADSAWYNSIVAGYEYKVADEYNCLLRKFTINEDSVLFYGSYFNVDENGEILGLSLEQPDELKFTLPYKYNSVTFEFAAPYFIEEDKTLYSHMLEGFDKDWSKWSTETKAIYTNLNEGTYTFKVKAKNIYEIESSIATYEFTIDPPWYRTILAYIVYIISGIFLVFFIVRFYTRRLKRENERLERIVQERTAEVVKQKDEIESQRDKIAAQNKDITDSIHYASRIQRALLPSERLLKQNYPEHFVLFRPRDIVSGDFYWMTQNNGKSFIVAADCTGHGVPGAFMSMLGISFLNEIVNKSGVMESGKILNELRTHVVEALKQEGKIGEQKDGMDLAILAIDKKRKLVEFSGANNPVYWIRPLTDKEKEEMKQGEVELPRGIERNDKYELKQVNADKMPIGISIKMDIEFSTEKIPLEVGHRFYIFSDGYVDQFGGEKGKKFMSRAFKNMLLQVQDMPLAEQRKVLNTTIEKWMAEGTTEQVDDMLVIGIKIDKL